MKKLIIVESPTKAKTIQKYLGDGYVVLASKGHVCDLPAKSLGIDVEKRFQPQYIITPEKTETIKTLKRAVEKYKDVYLATDPDREGEAISWHLQNVLEIKGDAPRIEFHEITKSAVTAAITTPRPLNMNLVNSQQARRVLDRLVGYKISPILSIRIRHGASAGRVQSAALEMIVTREREVTGFVPEEYWNINALLSKEGDASQFKAAFYDIDGKKYKPSSKEQADRVLLASDGAEYSVASVVRKQAKGYPQPPFTTSSMTQDAAQKLGLSSDSTMRLAQQLYEGIDIEGEGMTALITYIRTDSVRVSPAFAFRSIEYIAEHFGAEYAPAKPNMYKTKGLAQDAHEAIRPISLQMTPESLKNKLKRDQYRLYKLIYERFLASMMTPALYNTLAVNISAKNASITDKTLGFRVTGRTLIFKGYTAVYDNTPAEKEGDEAEEKGVDSIPNMKEGDKLTLHKLTSEQKFTKPPVRFTDGTIIKAMEENGIGRPSTYATVVPVLTKREYIVKDGKSIMPTELGVKVCDYMMKSFPEIMDLKFTANMEADLDKIEEGNGEWQEVIERFYPTLIGRIRGAGAPDSDGVKQPDTPTDEICDKCGSSMVIKDGRFGRFLACSNYPKCKNTRHINEVVGKCPKCGGDICKRMSKKGKPYYVCSNASACDFIMWDLPAPKLCPRCGSPMKQVDRDGKTTYYCTDKNCKYREYVKKD